MAKDLTAKIKGHIETVLLELDIAEGRLDEEDLKLPEVRLVMSRIDAVRSEYPALIGQLCELGQPPTKEERLTVLRKIAAIESKASRMFPAIASGASSTASSCCTNGPQIQAKLPQINLPPFSGEIGDWLKWSRAFLSTVDCREDLTSDAKMQYLLTTLSGEALETIVNLDPIGASYATAILQLRERYENKAVILEYYLKRLLYPTRATEDGLSMRPSKIILKGPMTHCWRVGLVEQNYLMKLRPFYCWKICPCLLREHGN